MKRTERLALKGLGYFEDERAEDLPGWVPAAARNYLAHTEGGLTIRALAREARVHPSTILRQVRRMESSRDDPLVDSALTKLAANDAPAEDEEALSREALPVLRRLTEPDAVLAVARDMERGAVMRDGQDGEPLRLAVVDRRLAEAMALRDWIACQAPSARIRRYRITLAGRTELRRLEGSPGFAEAPASFLRDDDPDEDPRLRHMRSALAESPLQALARRKDDKGRPFLPRELVSAGERLREDFELVANERSLRRDWERWLTRLPPLAELEERPGASREEAARLRVERALADLGPGLADVALRCCCLLEGLEPLEKRMGWSARSGKVVLRIALARLEQHYRAEAVRTGAMIGQARPATRPRR